MRGKNPKKARNPKEKAQKLKINNRKRRKSEWHYIIEIRWRKMSWIWPIFSQERNHIFPYSSTLCSQHHFKKQIIFYTWLWKIETSSLACFGKTTHQSSQKEISSLIKKIWKWCFHFSIKGHVKKYAYKGRQGTPYIYIYIYGNLYLYLYISHHCKLQISSWLIFFVLLFIKEEKKIFDTFKKWLLKIKQLCIYIATL